MMNISSIKYSKTLFSKNHCSCGETVICATELKDLINIQV